MSDSFDFTVILATRNRASILGEAIEPVLRQETRGFFTYEILVADNGSTDDTKAVVEKIAAQAAVPVRYIYEDRRGKPYALNAAMKEARGRFFAFVDDDTLAAPDWLACVFKCFKEEQADAVSGKILPKFMDERPAWYTDRAFWQIGGMGCIDHGPARAFSRKQKDCRWVGGNMAFRREAVDKVGGYDPRMVRGQDTEYYQRFVKQGLAVVYEPAAVVYHKIGADRMTLDYFRRWRDRAGYYYAYLVEWRKLHLITVMPVWRYQRLWELFWIWVKKNWDKKEFWERFEAELRFREELGLWAHRLQLWPRWWLTVITKRSYLPNVPVIYEER